MAQQRSTWDLLNEPDPWGANTGGDYQTNPNDAWAASGKQTTTMPNVDLSQARPRHDGQQYAGGGTGVGEWSEQDRAALNASYEQFLGRSAGPDDFAAHANNPGGLQGAQQAVQNSPEASSYRRVEDYRRAVEQLANTTDPTQRAMQQDQLARQVYNDLKNGGHDVKWDGDVLVVDGRRYTVGPGPGQAPPPAPGGGGTQPYSDRALQDILNRYPPTNDGIRQAMAEIERVFGPGTVQLLDHPDRLDKLVLPDGRVIDVIIGAGGANPQWGWLQEGGHGGSGGGGYMGGDIGTLALPGGAGGASAVDPGPRPERPDLSEFLNFQPTSPTYTPGEIPTNDLPRASYEEIVARLGGYTPTAVDAGYTFGGFDNMEAGTEAATEALIQQLLENPESLPPHVVEALKGASREELAQMAASLDQDMIGMGYSMGIDSSPWLASERLAAKRSRDEAIQASNRDIDLTAAATNMGDRRAAAQLGAAYGDTVARRRLAEAQAAEGNKQVASAQALQAAMFNEQNVFNAAQLQSNNALAAMKMELDQAALANDRLALREQVTQKATELGISRDKVMTDYLTSIMGELVQLYGIDISAYVDLTQLSTANSEFKEDLAFRLLALQEQLKYEYAALREGGRQFDIGAGIDVAMLQQRAREHRDNMLYRAYGV